ncbi:hypothetical protein [Parerythrobacter jejuensis]|uniref:Uncharacterized protein n=1 Tax=Parerythrobacter jejuensis TaxID=795812 RepID=A0A845AI48_9SPHN|nr:hypothetical protein [Parerythrobacter jejuensis]MXP30332.1 hypothetical protein [Parerythrobacter jejuensis]MXP33092.1 hypothetical protein [Parerythrobacter jejuensis]
MSHWVLGSEEHPDGTRDVTINFNNDDSNGQMQGVLTLEGKDYAINGSWAASGSLPGRNASAFGLWGSNQSDATVYISAVGTMQGPGRAPESVTINVNRASSADDLQFAWDGVLKPM